MVSSSACSLSCCHTPPRQTPTAPLSSHNARRKARDAAARAGARNALCGEAEGLRAGETAYQRGDSLSYPRAFALELCQLCFQNLLHHVCKPSEVGSRIALDTSRPTTTRAQAHAHASTRARAHARASLLSAVPQIRVARTCLASCFSCMRMKECSSNSRTHSSSAS